MRNRRLSVRALRDTVGSGSSARLLEAGSRPPSAAVGFVAPGKPPGSPRCASGAQPSRSRKKQCAANAAATPPSGSKATTRIPCTANIPASSAPNR